MPKPTLILILLAATTLFFSACTDPEQLVQQYLQEAQKLEQEGFLEDALILLSELDQNFPGRQDIMEPMAFLYARLQMNAHAADAFLRIAEIEADNDLYYLYAADQQSMAGNDNDAIRHYRQYVHKHPKDTETLEKLGELLLKRNRYQDAIQYLTQKQQLAPSGHTALSLAQAFLALSNITQAQYWFEVAYQLDPQQEVSALSGLVEIAIQNNQFDQADELMKKLKTKYPQELQKEPLLSLSQQLERFRKEHEVMQQMLNSEPVVEVTAVAEVSVPVEAQVTETSEQTIPPATDTVPTASAAATAETAIEETTEATVETSAVATTVAEPEQEVVSTPVISNNKNILPPELLAEVEESLRQETTPSSSESAVTTEEVELPEETTTPEIDTTELDRARQLAQQGNHQAAADAYWKFLAQHDQDAVVWSELSALFVQMNQLQAARATILEASRRDPQNLQYVLQSLHITQRLETPENYLRALQQTRVRHPRSPDIALALARTYANQQDSANSEFYYREFIRLSDADHPARQEAESMIGLSSF